MKNFRISLKKDGAKLRKSVAAFENDALKTIAAKMVSGGEIEQPIDSDWLKAHGDVTWGKS